MDNEATIQLNDQRKREKKALFTSYQGLDEAMFEIIAPSRTSKEAWDTFTKSIWLYGQGEKRSTYKL